MSELPATREWERNARYLQDNPHIIQRTEGLAAVAKAKAMRDELLARIAELEATAKEQDAVRAKYAVLIQADVLGHPDHKTVCGHYPEDEREWLDGLVTWMKQYDDQDPQLFEDYARARAEEGSGT